MTKLVVLFLALATTVRGSFANDIDHAAVAQKSNQSIGRDKERKIVINFDKKHPFMGFGAVIWPGSPYPEQRQELMKSTNMTWVRIPLLSYFKFDDYKQGMSANDLMAQRYSHTIRAKVETLSVEQLAKLKEADSRTTERYALLAQELKQAKIRLIVAALPAPPKEWVQPFKYGNNLYQTFKGGQPGQTDHRHDYINLVVAEIAAATQAGLHIDAIEFPGEPDMPSSGMRPDVADSMVGIMRKVMNSSGLSTVAIYYPGTAATFSAPRYIEALQARKGNVSLIKYFAVHDYDMATRPAPAGLSHELLAAVKESRPIIVTEFGDVSKRWTSSPYSGGPKHASEEEGLSPTNATNHSEYGVSAAAEGLKLIGDGASGICIWQMHDIYWMKSSFGLIDLRGKLRPAAIAFATFMKLLERGAEIYSVPGPTGPGMAVTAFTVSHGNEHHVIVAIANITNSPIPLQLKLTGATSGLNLDSQSLSVAATYPDALPVSLGGKPTEPSLLIPANALVVLKNY